MFNVKDNDRKELNILNNEITQFCNIKDLENNITENIAEYTSISSKLYGILKLIVQEREGQKSKLRDEISRLKVLNLKLTKFKKNDKIDYAYINNLKQHQKFIESCAELKGGCFSVWGSKIKKALEKFNKIDMLQHIKMAILNDNINSIIITYTKLIKIEDIEKQVDDFFKECKYKIDDAKKYLGIAKKFWDRIQILNRIISTVLRIEINLEATLKTIPDLDIFKQDGKAIFQHLAKIGLWFQSIKNYEVGQKNIKVANTMAEIDVEKFKTDLESKKIDEEEKERIQKEKEEKERIQKEKEEKEKKYKENLPKEIEKHKNLITGIAKILEKFNFNEKQKNEIKQALEKMRQNNHASDKDFENNYANIMSNFEVKILGKSDANAEYEKMCYLIDVSEDIKVFKELQSGKLLNNDKYKFGFNDNSVTITLNDRSKRTYTLKNNQLTLENYSRDTLSSTITIK